MFDTTELYAAAVGRPELEESIEEDVEALRTLCGDLESAKEMEQELQETCAEILDRELPGYSDNLARVRENAEEAKVLIKARLTKYAPRGGMSVTLGDQKYGIKKSSSSFKVDTAAITDEWLVFLADQEVDGRPLVVPTLNERLLHEAIRREIVDKDELIEAGILVESARSPAWHTSKVGGGRR